LFVTGMNVWIRAHQAIARVAGAGNLQQPRSVALLADQRTVAGGFPSALLLPFVPNRRSGKKSARRALKRPSFAQLFSPELRRTTLGHRAVSACAYAPRLARCN